MENGWFPVFVMVTAGVMNCFSLGFSGIALTEQLALTTFAVGLGVGLGGGVGLEAGADTGADTESHFWPETGAEVTPDTELAEQLSALLATR